MMEWMAGHDHAHSHGTGSRSMRALAGTLCLTMLVVVAELAGSVAFGSLALRADAIHVLADAAALALALVAQRVAARPPSETHSFGWRRAEVLAAQANGIVLVAVSIWVVVAAAGRLHHHGSVDGAGVMAVAAVGLGVNLLAALWLHGSAAHNVNARGALLHALSDALGSFGAVVAGFVILLGGPIEADAVISMFIAVLVAIFGSAPAGRGGARVVGGHAAVPRCGRSAEHPGVTATSSRRAPLARVVVGARHGGALGPPGIGGSRFAA